MFIIKACGEKKKLCSSINKLLNALSTQYVGKDVSVIEHRPSGINISHFISVTNDGAITPSYSRCPLLERPDVQEALTNP